MIRKRMIWTVYSADLETKDDVAGWPSFVQLS
jgi:hypothetical protein